MFLSSLTVDSPSIDPMGLLLGFTGGHPTRKKRAAQAEAHGLIRSYTSILLPQLPDLVKSDARCDGAGQAARGHRRRHRTVEAGDEPGKRYENQKASGRTESFLSVNQQLCYQNDLVKDYIFVIYSH